jgi:hypothetical protein
VEGRLASGLVVLVVLTGLVALTGLAVMPEG